MSSVQYQHFHNLENVRMKLKVYGKEVYGQIQTVTGCFKRALTSGIRNAVDMQNIIIIQS